ncbi:TlpA disulfide reductase family protein [Lipingzhangella sp. LS1_29]|uniref:TlpA disulfide reductase family protein n=1 Tax=Lipingzhangella rawalii TaxID=2055835 RepID=A0ABU2H8V7_9ACTN|nr:TlpA disulfide reductase family protein [Lipingzhangella rawalii]MDS1271731.1 TlpA disulfide reductase family protein [Lipingzhangella rawalii]
MRSLHGFDLGRPERLAAVLVTVGLLSGCAGMDVESGDADNRYIEGDGVATEYSPDEREEAPDIEGETLDGDQLSMSELGGDDVVVVNFWASWCAPCRAEKPVLQEVREENAENGVTFLGVNIKDDRNAAQSFESNFEVPYPSLYDQPGEIPQTLRDTVPPQAVPSTLVIDREGRIAGRIIGASDYRTLSELLESILDGEDGSNTAAGSAFARGGGQ